MRKLFFLILAASIFTYTSSASAANKPAVKTADKVTPASPAEKKPAAEKLKEFDLARKLVDTLGFSEGLPAKPVEKDYLQILGGNRTFKFEAENSFDSQSDPVTVRDFPLYGAFSGKGWLHATTNRVAVHFKVFIPVTGKYTLKVTARGDNQLWSVAGKAFKHSSGDKFSESDVGQVFIPAGDLEFNAVIDPAGAIDTFTFTAPAYTPIEPLAGWNSGQQLTAAPLNETIASLLGLEPLLPVDSGYKTKVIEAASLPELSSRVQLTDKQIYGTPVAAKWVRAFQAPANLAVPLEIESTAVYALRVRALGTTLTAGFGQQRVTVTPKPYLDWIDLGTFRLPKGKHSLEIQLPPMGGVDIIEVIKKLSSPADYAAITKSGIQGNAPLQPAELDAIIKSLKDQFKERR